MTDFKIVTHMKTTVFLIAILSSAHHLWSCSCFGPYERDFFKVVKKSHQVYFGTVENVDFSYSYKGLKAYTMYLKVTDTLAGCESAPGKTIVITGQDGLNCGESMSSQWITRNIVVAVEKRMYYTYGPDTFYLHGCGAHLQLFNTQGPDGTTIEQIKIKIRSLITGTDDISRGSNLIVFPNPADDVLNVFCPDHDLLDARLISYGNQVVSIPIDSKSNFLSIPLKDFLPGVYIIVLWTDYKKIIKRFVKL